MEDDRFSLLSFRRSAVLMAIWPIGIVFMHFTFSDAGGQILNVGMLANVLVYALALPRLLALRIQAAILTLFVVAVTVAVAMADSDLDAAEFAKSFAQLTNLSLMVMLASSLPLPRTEDVECGVRLLLLLASLHAVLLVMQFVAMNAFGNTALLHPFGPFTRTGPLGDPYVPSFYDTVLRTAGFFSEPSAAAWFSGFCLAVALAMNLVKGRSDRAAVVIGAGSVFTGSMSGVVNITLLTLSFAWLRITRFSRRDVAVALGLFTLLLLIGLTYVQSSYFLDRINELREEGASLYVRISSPVMLLTDSFVSHPFGHALGSEKYILSKSYSVVNEATVADPGKIHNGFFLILFYYGWLGVGAVLLALGYLIRLFALRRPSALILTSLYLAIAASGGLWSPPSVLMIGFGVVLMRYVDGVQRSTIAGHQ